MDRIFIAFVIVVLGNMPSCIAQTTGREHVDLTIAAKADWVGGGPPGGETCAIAQDRRNPDVLHVGTTSGVFKSTDAGQSWNIASNGLPRLTGPCYELEIDPSRPLILFAGIFGRIYKTTDGGINWASSDEGLSEAVLPSIDPTNTDRVYTFSGGRIFKSTNGGGSWTPVATAGLLEQGERVNTSLIVDHTNPAILYVGMTRGIFKSNDAGASWSSASTGLTDRYIGALAIDPTNSRILYAAAGGRIYQSTTAGASWEVVGDSFVGAFKSLVVDPSNPNTLFVATETEVFRSPARGTWQRITPNGNRILINSLAISAQDSTLFACTWTGLFRSANAGSVWSAANSGLTPQGVSHLAVLDPDGRIVLAAGTYGGLFRSSDYGDHWDVVKGLLPGKISSLATSSIGRRVVFAIVENEIYQSTDEGITWSRLRIDNPSSDAPLPMLDSGQSAVIRADFRNGVLYSLDGGVTWSFFRPLIPMLRGAPRVLSLWVDPHNVQSLFAGGLLAGGSLYRSRDGGQTWVQASEAPRASNYSLFLDPNHTGTIYMLTHEGSFPGHTYKSTDNGFHWEPMLVDVPLDAFPQFLAMIPAEPTVLFMTLADNSGDFPRPTSLFKSIDQGAHWTRAHSGLPSTATVGPIASAPGDVAILYLSVGGAGVFKSTDGGEHWRPTGSR